MSRRVPLFFALATLTSAFLVFQVQPLMSKCVLPWFGGSPAVWTTCMLFFQCTLFLGYLYAHLTTRCFSPRTQGIVHVALVAVALLLLPITPDDAWRPTESQSPTLWILLLLAVHVGLPYFVLSSTGPLLQAWLARSAPESSPYRLYALSNLGSLVALLSYPLVVEPRWSTRQQGQLWSAGFALFAMVCGYLAWRVWVERRSSEQPTTAAASTPAPSTSARLTWLGLAALPSLML